ncbi:hypothetical protein [Luedemannella helvata]|uniref:Ig-like domain-containing protein n=1 Tax=Luedemannella helvata TaxID=349315 RepID=A0ABN2KTZ0_9ACTN
MTTPQDPNQQPGYPPAGHPPPAPQGYPPPPGYYPGQPQGYPPQGHPNPAAGYPPGYPVPNVPPPKRTPWGLIITIIAVCLVLLCGGVVGCVALVATRDDSLAGFGGDDDRLTPEERDIIVLACTTLPGQTVPTVTVTWEVRNSESAPRDYSPTFVVQDAEGDKLGEGGDTRTGLPPGQARVFMTLVRLDKGTAGAVTCGIKD